MGETGSNMYYVIAKDNLNRDYHNDRLVADFEARLGAEIYCQMHNYDNSPYFHTITISVEDMNLESAYDINGEIHSYTVFCNFTGLTLVPIRLSRSMYNKHYNIKD